MPLLVALGDILLDRTEVNELVVSRDLVGLFSARRQTLLCKRMSSCEEEGENVFLKLERRKLPVSWGDGR